MALGYPHPDILLEQITSRQLGEWIAYYRIDPWGEERADLRSGIVSSTMANINRKKGAKAFKPSDFMPEFIKQKEDDMDAKQVRQQTIDVMSNLVAIQNKKKG